MARPRDRVRPMMGNRHFEERRRPERRTEPRRPPSTMSWPTFLRKFWQTAGPYWHWRERPKATILGAFLLFCAAVQVGVQFAINRWIKALYDALNARQMIQFAQLVGVLLFIIAVSVFFENLAMRVKRRLQIDWREWLTERLIYLWTASGRHYQLANVGGPYANPDARLTDQSRIATEYAIDLAHDLVYDLLLLVTFVQVLVDLSDGPYFVLNGRAYFVPGYLVCLAVVYASIGTLIAFASGRAIVDASTKRQAAEADFRSSIVRAQADALGVALAQGERDQRARLRLGFHNMRKAWDNFTRSKARTLYFISIWSVLEQMFPVLAVAPRYLSGLISLGELLQSVQAFSQVLTGLTWTVRNLHTATDWRGSAESVIEFAGALEAYAAAPDRQGLIERVSGPPGFLTLQSFVVSSRADEPKIEEFSLQIREGEWVLWTGETFPASNVMKAIAGVWPWGRGKIELPVDATLLFMPPRPYLPAGTLRDAIDYPPDNNMAARDDRDIPGALERVGLSDLINRLDESSRWDEALSDDDQQRIGFARVLLRRPDWIFMDDAIRTLQPDGQREMLDLLRSELPRVAVIAIGDDDTLLGRETRRFVFEESLDSVSMREEKTSHSWA